MCRYGGQILMKEQGQVLLYLSAEPIVVNMYSCLQHHFCLEIRCPELLTRTVIDINNKLKQSYCNLSEKKAGTEE